MEFGDWASGGLQLLCYVKGNGTLFGARSGK
jgi:hypothetical protein